MVIERGSFADYECSDDVLGYDYNLGCAFRDGSGQGDGFGLGFGLACFGSYAAGSGTGRS